MSANTSKVFESESDKARELESATQKALGHYNETLSVHEITETPNKAVEVPEKTVS